MGSDRPFLNLDLREQVAQALVPSYFPLGMTGSQALAMSGDPDGDLLSMRHARGDIANRWSHAAAVELVGWGIAKLGESLGLELGSVTPTLLAHMMFPLKEYQLDLNPDWSDIPFTIKVQKTLRGARASLAVTVFADAFDSSMSRAHDISPSIYLSFSLRH